MCGLVATQLFVEFGHVVVPLGLKEVAGYGISQIILFAEITDFELKKSLIIAQNWQLNEYLSASFAWSIG